MGKSLFLCAVVCVVFTLLRSALVEGENCDFVIIRVEWLVSDFHMMINDNSKANLFGVLIRQV